MFLKYSELLILAQKVVDNYIRRKAIPKSYRDDIVMAIVENFLLKEEKIANSFQARSKITTYCIAILNKMCCEQIRKSIKQWNEICEENIPESNSSFNDSLKDTIINDEIKYLDKILKLFGEKRFKIIMVLAYLYGLKLEKNKLLDNYSDDFLNEINTEKKKYSSNKSDKYQLISDVLLKTEQTKLSPDAIRMRMEKNIKTIIHHLNNPFNRASYDKESFKYLFEIFFKKYCNN
ncbi:MAG: hypothetical protein N4A49_02270 [Marinifilaceae bacterium]|jgi:predicted transcriptional regulator|nr:hypothetical protein [Marinifilaceae bacterium]